MVDLGLRACEAYGRPDLAARLAGRAARAGRPGASTSSSPASSSRARARWSTRWSGRPSARSTTTSPPPCRRTSGTARQPEASLLVDGGDAAPRERSRWRTCAGTSWRATPASRAPPADGARVAGVEVRLPRKMLAGGLVLVDTPGVGGLGSRARRRQPGRDLDGRRGAVRHRRRAGADPQRAGLPAAGPRPVPGRRLRLTKTDFYPAWRRIRELDEQHLAALGDVPLMPVSSPLRARAVKANDTGAERRVRLRRAGQVRHRAGRPAARRPAGRRGGAPRWPPCATSSRPSSRPSGRRWPTRRPPSGWSRS